MSIFRTCTQNISNKKSLWKKIVHNENFHFKKKKEWLNQENLIQWPCKPNYNFYRIQLICSAFFAVLLQLRVAFILINVQMELLCKDNSRQDPWKVKKIGRFSSLRLWESLVLSQTTTLLNLWKFGKASAPPPLAFPIPVAWQVSISYSDLVFDVLSHKITLSPLLTHLCLYNHSVWVMSFMNEPSKVSSNISQTAWACKVSVWRLSTA